MEEEEAARRLKELQALKRSNSALRCLFSLQSRRSAKESSWKASGEEPVPELLERYERLVEAVKHLQEDLRLARKKSELRRSRQCCADIARFVLFIAGSIAMLTIFQPDFPVALRDYVRCQANLLGYEARW